MNKLLLALFTFLYIIASAQKTGEDGSLPQYRNENCRSSFKKVTLDGIANETTIGKFLKSTLVNMADYRTGLKLNYRNESPGGFHYSFTQTFNGVNIYQSEIKVNTDRRNTIFALLDNSENTSNWNLNTTGAGSDAVIAIHAQKKVPLLCVRSVTDEGVEMILSNDEIIYQHEIKAYADRDSLVTGKVFLPDPLSSSERNYGLHYKDDSDKSNRDLAAQQQIVSFKATFSDSVFMLKSPYVKIAELRAPNIPAVTSTNGQFYYDRSQNGFEDVNAFYHISVMQSHIQQLGFGCADSLVAVDTHAGPEDNSFYLARASGLPGRIHLGTGGVDDAEDADVCVHEYGHHITATASPGSNIGDERNSLDEAFGDYLAATYSRSICSFRTNWIFNWDGHNEFWQGRLIDVDWHYPRDLNQNEYHNAQIWSTAVFELSDVIGRNATDSLMLQSIYSYAQGMSFIDASFLLMEADTLLNNGKYACQIYNSLFAHGLQPNNVFINCTVGINDAETLPFRYFSDAGSFTIVNNSGLKINGQIHNAAGQQILEFTSNQADFKYENATLAPGIYLVSIQLNGEVKTYKWSKVN